MSKSLTGLEVIEVKPGKSFPILALKRMLPDVETILFFAKVYGLDYPQLSNLLYTLIQTPVTEALSSGDHSLDLQDYIVDLDFPDTAIIDTISFTSAAPAPKGEILPHLWEFVEVEIADSIKVVADKLAATLDMMPGKTGEMAFKSMMVLNSKRPIIGDYRAHIHHAPKPPALVILDVSGSMTYDTIKTIVDDVVALSLKADAHLAIVSNTATAWEPGAFSSDDIMDKAEFGGTHYETLLPLFQNRNWGTVITIADYDSSLGAGQVLKNSGGHIGCLLDVSLVNQPTFLGECLSSLADEVRPLLIAQDNLTGSDW